MKKLFLLTVLCYFGLLRINGQIGTNSLEKKSSKTLGIGDRLPAVVLTEMMNYPKSSLRLSDYKGKWVIIDFWHTRCSACVDAFPEIQNLQKKYPNQVKFILVTYQSKKIITDFLKRNKEITGRMVTLPLHCNSKRLMDLFKPDGYPHYIWIDPKGVIRYITDKGEVNETNLDSAISNKSMNLHVSETIDFHFNIYKPLYVNGNGGDGSEIRCLSLLAKAQKNSPWTGEVYNAGTKNSALLAYGCSAVDLFQIAFNYRFNGYWLPKNRTELRVKDTAKYVYIKNGAIEWENQYSYQLFVPYQSDFSLRKMMQEDLKRYFGLDAKLERRRMKCWVMTAEDTSLLVTKGGNPENYINDANFSIMIRNIPDSLVDLRFIYGSFYEGPYPFISAVHMKSNIDIIMDGINVNDENAVMAALHKKYKLNFELTERDVDILCIRDSENVKPVQ